MANARERTMSVAIPVPNLNYREARQEVDNYLEQREEAADYGLEEATYRGRRTRESSLLDRIDLLIPFLVAAMTVLNTIRGSVYERRDEICIYNAVEIAPRLIFFIFFPEALVYVVIGSILGYLLSQETGRILTQLELPGGLNITFTSLSAVFASIALSFAVFASTWFPARTAAAIAVLSEDAGWSLPDPVEDVVGFDLTFNFRSTGRIAVLAFFNRYLMDHGEGSSGRFYSAPPWLGIGRRRRGLDSSEAIPQITEHVWLKPFGHAVSQRILLTSPASRRRASSSPG